MSNSDIEWGKCVAKAYRTGNPQTLPAATIIDVSEQLHTVNDLALKVNDMQSIAQSFIEATEEMKKMSATLERLSNR